MGEKPATWSTVIILTLALWTAMSIYFAASAFITAKLVQRIESRCAGGR